MMSYEENRGTSMRFFGRSKKECSKICHHFSANKTVTSQGIVDQHKCPTCNKYIFPNGFQTSRGTKTCKCCGDTLVYVHTIYDDSDLKESSTSSIPKSFTRDTHGRKTYDQFLDFIEEGMRLNANYQLVMLKVLVSKKIASKYEISEELAYQNNKNFHDEAIIHDFFHVPVYDVLEKRGFVKKVEHEKNNYLLNVELNEFQSDSILEILEKKLSDYNLEHNIPENEFENISTTSIPEKNISQNDSEIFESEKTSLNQNFWIWSTTPKNWEILKEKHVWGSRIPKEKISDKVKEGDLVAFYVIGTNSFKGVFEFSSDWFDSPGVTWDDDSEPNGKLRYVSQIKILPIVVGNAKLGILHEKLGLFQDKTIAQRNLILQGGSGYPSNNATTLTESDFQEIISELKENKDLIPDDNPVPESEVKSEVESDTFTVIENSPDGIHVKEFSQIKSEEILKGQVLSNDDLINKLGVGNMGGIRYSKKNNLLVLCSTLSDDYSDALDPKSGLYVYSGEGQTGDQELTKGNQKILESKSKMLFFKEKYQEPGARKRGALDNIYEFVGPVNYVKHFWIDEKDKEGRLRKVVKFVLEVEE